MANPTNCLSVWWWGCQLNTRTWNCYHPFCIFIISLKTVPIATQWLRTQYLLEYKIEYQVTRFSKNYWKTRKLNSFGFWPTLNQFSTGVCLYNTDGCWGNFPRYCWYLPFQRSEYHLSTISRTFSSVHRGWPTRCWDMKEDQVMG